MENRTAALVERIRRLAEGRDVVLLDYTTNGDVTDLASPLSHAALIRLHIEGRWPQEDHGEEVPEPVAEPLVESATAAEGMPGS